MSMMPNELKCSDNLSPVPPEREAQAVAAIRFFELNPPTVFVTCGRCSNLFGTPKRHNNCLPLYCDRCVRTTTKGKRR